MAGDETEMQNAENNEHSVLKKYKEEMNINPKRRLSLPNALDNEYFKLNRSLVKIPSAKSIEDSSANKRHEKRLSLPKSVGDAETIFQNLNPNLQIRRVSIAVGESSSQLRNLHHLANQKPLGPSQSKRRGSDLSIGSQRRLSRVSVECPSKVPDGGYGWVVVAAASLVWCLAPGFSMAFGLFFVEFLKIFKESKSKTAWIGSVLSCMIFIGAPISSACCKKFGIKAVGFAGSIITFAALITSTYATSVILLIVSFGFFGGLGIGLVQTASLICVAFYFDKRQSFAMGLTTCGVSVGFTCFPPLIELLIKTYGWKGAVLISAAILLNCLVCFHLMRPLHSGKKTSTTDTWQGQLPQATQLTDAKTKSESLDESDQQVTPSDQNTSRSNAISQTTNSSNQQEVVRGENLTEKVERSKSHQTSENLSMLALSSNQRDNLSPNVQYKENNCGNQNREFNLMENKEPRLSYIDIEDQIHLEKIFNMSRRKSYKDDMKILWQYTLDAIDLTFLWNPVFVFYATMYSLTSAGTYTGYLYIVDYGVLLGMPETYATMLLSILGSAGGLSRLVIGKLSDMKPNTDPFITYGISVVCCGLVTIASTFVKHQALYFCFAVTLGTVSGIYSVLTPVMAVDLVGVDHMGTVMSLGLMIAGLIVLTMVPFAGWLYDVTQSYNATFTFSGTAFILSGVMAFTLRVFAKCVNKNKDTVD